MSKLFKEMLLFKDNLVPLICALLFVFAKSAFFDRKVVCQSMKYISLLGLVASIASGYSLNSLPQIEEVKIAQMATDIFAEQQGNSLVFKKISVNKAEVTPELLNSDLLFAPYILFTFKDNHWFAEQTDSLNFLVRMLKFKESEDSFKCVVIGADKINVSAEKVQIKLGSQSHTKLVELVCV